MSKQINNLLKIMFIFLIALFSFQTSSSEVNAESTMYEARKCTIKMGSFKFIGCWGNTNQFCKSKGDCSAAELEQVAKMVQVADE